MAAAAILDSLLGDMLELLEAEAAEAEDLDDASSSEDGQVGELEQLLNKRGFPESLVQALSKEPASSSAIATIMRQANLWVQAKSQIQTIVNTCTSIVANEGETIAEQPAASTQAQVQARQTVERGVSPLPVRSTSRGTSTQDLEVPIRQTATRGVSPMPVTLASKATSTDDLSSASGVPQAGGAAPAQDEAVKAQKADMVAKLSRALSTKHLLFKSGGVPVSASGPFVNGEASTSSGPASASTSAEPRPAPATGSSTADPRRRPTSRTSLSVNTGLANDSRSSKVKGKEKEKPPQVTYKTTMDDFLDMDMDFEGLPAPDDAASGAESVHHGLTEPLYSASKTQTSESVTAGGVDMQVDRFIGTAQAASSTPMSTRLDELQGKIQSSSTSTAITNTASTVQAPEELNPPPLTELASKSTSPAAPSPILSTAAERPPPTADPRLRAPLAPSTLKSMFVSRPNAAARPARAMSPDLPKQFSTRPVPIPKPGAKAIDRDRAREIHEDARRASEKLREEEKAAEERERSVAAEASPPPQDTVQGGAEHDDGDSAMHDLFSGEDDDDDEEDEDEDAPLRRSAPASAVGSTANLPSKASAVSSTSAVSADDSSRTREEELRNRLKRTREEQTSANGSVADATQAGDGRAKTAGDEQATQDTSQSQPLSSQGSPRAKIRKLVPVIEVPCVNTPAGRKGIVVRKTTGAPRLSASSASTPTRHLSPATGLPSSNALAASTIPDAEQEEQQGTPLSPPVTMSGLLRAPSAAGADGHVTNGPAPVAAQDVDMQPIEGDMANEESHRELEAGIMTEIAPGPGPQASTKPSAPSTSEKSSAPAPAAGTAAAPTVSKPVSQDRTTNGKAKAPIPAGSKVIEIPDTSEESASEDEAAPIRPPTSTDKGKQRETAATAHREVPSSDDELPDLPFSQSARAASKGARKSSAPSLAARKTSAVRPAATSASQPVSANPNGRKSKSPLPANEAPTIRRAVDMQPSTPTETTAEQKRLDDEEYFRQDIMKAWGNAGVRVQAAPAKAAPVPAASSKSSTSTAKSGALPSFKRKDKPPSATAASVNTNDDRPTLYPPGRGSAASQSKSASAAQSGRAKTGLPARPSAITIASGGQDKLPSLPSPPLLSESARAAATVAGLPSRPKSGLPPRPDEETRQRAEALSRSASPPKASRQASPPRASATTTVQQEERFSSPPFQAGSPPPTFDWLRSPPPEAAPTTSGTAAPANGTALSPPAQDTNMRIASSQTPEPQQLTDAEMDLPPPTVNGHDSDAEIDELADDDEDGEPDQTIGPERKLPSPVASSPPSPRAAASTSTTNSALDQAADKLLTDIGNTLLNGGTQPVNSTTRNAGRAVSGESSSVEAEEVQAQLLPGKQQQSSPPRRTVERPSAQSRDGSDSVQTKSGRMTASDLMPSSQAGSPSRPAHAQLHSSPASAGAPSEADSVEIIVASQGRTTALPFFTSASAEPTAAAAATSASVSSASIDQIDRALSDPPGHQQQQRQAVTRCRFGIGCINSNCRFAHPSPAAHKDAHSSLPTLVDNCSSGVKCTDASCARVHPSPAAKRSDWCRDQENCPFGAGCLYRHAPQPTVRAKKYNSHNQSAVFNSNGSSNGNLAAAPSLSRSSSADRVSATSNGAGPLPYLSTAAQTMLMGMQNQQTNLAMQAYHQQLQNRYAQQQGAMSWQNQSQHYQQGAQQESEQWMQYVQDPHQ